MTTISGGSSPLARGLLPRRHRIKGAARIIPARAGFTHNSSDDLLEQDGSSPLARGLHEGLRNALNTSRIIPARAGFTEYLNERIIDH